MYNFQRDLYGEFSAGRADVIFWQELYRRVKLKKVEVKIFQEISCFISP